MKKIISSICCMFALSASAKNLEFNYFQSTDNDGMKVTRQVISSNFNNVNIGIGEINFSGPNSNYKSQILLVEPNIKIKNIETYGNAGIGKSSNKNYFTGDLTTTVSVNKDTKLNISVFGDLVDSEQSLNESINFYGSVVSVEWSNNYGGIVIGPKIVKFSNNNLQKGYVSKLWIPIIDGVNFYVSSKDYTNSLPVNGLYFSPEKYNRSGYGISFRKKVYDIKVSGFVEQSVIDTKFTAEKATSYRIQFDWPISENLKGLFISGKDFGVAGNFKYQYNNVIIKYTF